MSPTHLDLYSRFWPQTFQCAVRPTSVDRVAVTVDRPASAVASESCELTPIVHFNLGAGQFVAHARAYVQFAGNDVLPQAFTAAAMAPSRAES